MWAALQKLARPFRSCRAFPVGHRQFPSTRRKKAPATSVPEASILADPLRSDQPNFFSNSCMAETIASMPASGMAL